jgi:UDP-N-acetylmuramoyl-tripeptide--D-alanyl-D-alanine ligase
VILFGSQDGADVAAGGVTFDPASGRASFELRMPVGAARLTLPVAGAHMVPNALAAAAVGLAAGLGVEAIAEGLRSARLSAGRMEVTETAGGIRVIDDAYNANPASMAAALRTARAMAGEGRSIAVLGAMAELGSIAVQEHERVGELVVRLGIDRLIAVGAGAGLIAAAAEREGMEPDRIERVPDADEAAAAVRAAARPGDLVLIKASRVEGLDRVARSLVAPAPDRIGTGGDVAA